MLKNGTYHSKKGQLMKPAKVGMTGSSHVCVFMCLVRLFF